MANPTGGSAGAAPSVASGTDAKAPSFNDYADLLRSLVPALPDSLAPEDSLRMVFGSDRLLRALCHMALRSMGAGLPEQLVLSIATFGEAYAWYLDHCVAGQLRKWSSSGSFDEVLLDGPLVTERVRLRPVLPSDVPRLYEAAVRPESGHCWFLRGVTPSPQSFAERLYQSTLVQYAVVRTDSGALSGLVDAYDPALADGHVKLGIISTKHSEQLPMSYGEVFEGTLLFVTHLFRTFNVRKVYAEIPGFNWPQFASGEGFVFETEGVMRQHDFFAGRFWDRRVVAIYREPWGDFAGQWLQALSGNESG